mgnify:CR=1 FL=1
MFPQVPALLEERRFLGVLIFLGFQNWRKQVKKYVFLSSGTQKLKTGSPFRKTTFFGDKNVWMSRC